MVRAGWQLVQEHFPTVCRSLGPVAGRFQSPLMALYLCPVYHFPVRLWIVHGNNDS